ncbi:2,3-bisphosphoglycerate-independent phosphoglycerate mutase [candidate division KSB1 bacterium]
MELKLEKLKSYKCRPGPLLLIIMDGIGIGPDDERNAVLAARTPVLDRLLKLPMQWRLCAHGAAVGLPTEEDMGNSEVGHNAIGAGRVFDQGAKLVNKKIDNGQLFETHLWGEIVDRGKKGKTVHFIGLLSDGNVHSHIDHLHALINNCGENGLKRVCVHTLLDGRDVGERTALGYIDKTEALLDRWNSGSGLDYRIASGGGRMKVTMDRYKADWDIVKRGWNAHVHGIGRKFSSASEAVRSMYDEDPSVNDQFLDAFVIVSGNNEPVGTIENGDVVVFFNFRGDRAIEISSAFEKQDFSEFDRGNVPDVLFAGMLEYDGDLQIPKKYLVDPPHIDRTVSEYLCAEQVTSFAISETQKYGHVTYFWNGNKSGYIDKSLETYVEIPSDRIQFEKKPEMKAYEITEKTIELLRSGKYRFGRVNFANGDMVGHSGVYEAAVSAVETVDVCVGKLVEVVSSLNGISIVTADHGNADEMYYVKDGKKVPITSHTLNPVPFIIIDPLFRNDYAKSEIEKPGLSNIAATILNLLGFEKVADYDASLIEIK